MRLISITVRNYRIHRELQLDFEAALNLIGGENESGKSTLTEAIHRVLFLKARQTGALQAAMVSDRHPGQPEVELEFEIQGDRYRVAKRFSGASGSCTLSHNGEVKWNGAEAEEKLGELLGLGGTKTGGRMTPALLATRWSHLWVWQGSGWNDPSEEATRERDSLLARLKEQGGGGAMQSELDGGASTRIGELHGENFTANGSVKAHSALDTAAKAVASAEEILTRRQAEVEERHDAATLFLRAEKTIRECEAQLEKNETDSKQVRESLNGSRDLLKRIELQRPVYDQIEKEYQQLRDSDTLLKDLSEKIAVLSSQRKEEMKDLERLSDAAELRSEKLSELGRGSDAKDSRLQDATKQKELAACYLRLLEVGEKKQSIAREYAELDQVEEQRKLKELELARLPQIDPPSFAKLQQLQNDLTEARALLQAMGAQLSLRKSDQKIQVGETQLHEGETIVVQEEATVKIGSQIEIEISPGGGTSLEEARENEKKISATLEKTLSQLGLTNKMGDGPDSGYPGDSNELSAAQRVLSQRQVLEAEIASIRSGISGRRAPEQLLREKDQIFQEYEAASAEVARRSDLLTGTHLDEPHSLSEARILFEEKTQAHEKAERKSREARQERTTLQQLAEQAEQKRKKQQQLCDKSQQSLQELQTRARVFEENHGNETERQTRIESLLLSREKARKELENSEQQLQALQPEQLRSDLSRFERVVEESSRLRDQAREERAIAREQLRRDGSRDIRELFQEAKAHCEFAQSHYESVDRRARALGLLKELFLDEQRALADQFTHPLVEKISGYLECLFGLGATVRVDLNEKGFEGLRLVREGEAFDFDNLSGGTREQAAAAVRLAMAEILAENHGGTLPILFDDAFANSDESRIESLQRMLDLGARRGLQIIVLTCDPTRYAGLGARMHRLGISAN